APAPRARPSGPCPKASGDLPFRFAAFARGHELYLPVIWRAYDHALDIDAGQVDAVGIEAADRNHLLHLGHADAPASGGGQVEIARRLAEDEVAAFIALPCLHDGQVGEDSA